MNAVPSRQYASVALLKRCLSVLVGLVWVALNFVWVFLRLPVKIFMGFKVLRVVLSYPDVPIEAYLNAGAYIAIELFIRHYRANFSR